MNQADTLHLIRRCRASEAHAVEELVGLYQPVVFRMALSIMDDPAEADEAAQDTLVRVLGALDSYRGDAAFTTWLYAITLNVCRGRLRKRRARERLARVLGAVFHLGRAETAAHPEAAAQQHEAEAAVWQAIRALPENLRLPIILRYYHDLTVAEMAEVLQVSDRTVHTRLHAAHERLRVLLKDKPR